MIAKNLTIIGVFIFSIILLLPSPHLVRSWGQCSACREQKASMTLSVVIIIITIIIDYHQQGNTLLRQDRTLLSPDYLV